MDPSHAASERDGGLSRKPSDARDREDALQHTALEDGDAIADGTHRLELVGDEHDGRAEVAAGVGEQAEDAG